MSEPARKTVSKTVSATANEPGRVSSSAGDAPELPAAANSAVDAGNGAGSRRRFIAATAGAALATLAPALTLVDLSAARAPEAPASGRQRFGLLIDTDQCASGCTACVEACNAENGLAGTGRPRTDPQWIRKVELVDRRTGRQARAPVMCQHCAEPPCVDVCPTGASFKRADGIVLVDRHTCIGCRYCVMACPYKARSFVHETLADQRPDVPRGKGCVESCTLCVHRVDRGEQPACVDACAAAGHRAMQFGDLADPASEIARRVARESTARLRADLRLDTAVHYRGI